MILSLAGTPWTPTISTPRVTGTTSTSFSSTPQSGSQAPVCTLETTSSRISSLLISLLREGSTQNMLRLLPCSLSLKSSYIKSCVLTSRQNCDSVAVSEELIAEGMIGHPPSHLHSSDLVSTFWGSYFYHPEPRKPNSVLSRASSFAKRKQSIGSTIMQVWMNVVVVV